MYRSEDAKGAPVAVTGTYLEPSNPWTGQGARPLVAAAVGTHGQGDQCAPSKLFNTGIEYQFPTDVMVGYESIWVNTLLLNGIAVVVTDYEGLGTPGDHTYVNREAEAHAVLDSVRAAQQLPNASIPADGPVGLWGYSQGGGAAAAATELKPSYAPELDLKGTYAGAPPADLAATLQQVDGTFLTGVIGYALNGILAQYPEVQPLLDAEINDRGRQMLAATKNQCVAESGLQFGFQQSSSFTNSGESLSAVLARLPMAQAILDEQKIGKLTPESPVLIQHGRSDDIVPFGQGQQLARDWCGKGATVQFSVNELPPIIPGHGNQSRDAVPGGYPGIRRIHDRSLQQRPGTVQLLNVNIEKPRNTICSGAFRISTKRSSRPSSPRGEGVRKRPADARVGGS